MNGEMSSSNVLVDMVTARRVRWDAVVQRLTSHPDEARLPLPRQEFLLPSSSCGCATRRRHDSTERKEVGCLLCTSERTALHHALSRPFNSYPPLEVVDALLRAYPEAAWVGLSSDDSPLHAACRRRAPHETLQLLMKARPSVPSRDSRALLDFWDSCRDVFGGDAHLVEFCQQANDREATSILVRLYHLLHYCTASSQSPDPVGSSEMLVRPLSTAETSGETASGHDSSSLWHPANAAASIPFAPVEMLDLFLGGEVPLTSLLDGDGWSALHHAAAIGNAELEQMDQDSVELEDADGDDPRPDLACVNTIRRLVALEPDLCRLSDRKARRLPIHIAASRGLPIEALQLLYRQWPVALLRRDGEEGLYPALLAAASEVTTLDCLYQLLLVSPQVLRVHR